MISQRSRHSAVVPPLLFDLEIQACMSAHAHTHTHTAQIPPNPKQIPDHRPFPSLHKANPLREFPEPFLGEGRKVKSVHVAFFLAPLRSRQGKGSGVSGFKGSPGKASFSCNPS